MNVMHVEAKQGRADKDVTDLLVLLLSQGETILKQETASINTLLGGHLQTLLEQREFEGKANETLLVHTQGKTPAKRVLLVGVGAKKELRLDSFRQAMGSAVKRVRQAKVTHFHGGHALYDASRRHCFGDCPGDGGRSHSRQLSI